jgi:hypothetical protein
MSEEDSTAVLKSEPLLLPKNDLAHPGDVIIPTSSPPPIPNKDNSPTNSQLSIDNETISTTDVLIL